MKLGAPARSQSKQQPVETKMINLAKPEIWFICGSQHLYGPGPLKQVADNAKKIGTPMSRWPSSEPR